MKQFIQTAINVIRAYVRLVSITKLLWIIHIAARSIATFNSIMVTAFHADAFPFTTKIQIAAQFPGAAVSILSLSMRYHFVYNCFFFFFFHLAESGDIVASKLRSTEETTDPNLTCKFGKLTLDIGDTLNSDEEHTLCTCEMPPQPHCIQK